jgi:hypothetical protein
VLSDLFLPIIVFRVDDGRPSCLATSVLFCDGLFCTSSEMRSHSSKVRTCFKGNAIWGQNFIKRAVGSTHNLADKVITSRDSSSKTKTVNAGQQCERVEHQGQWHITSSAIISLL